MHINKVLILLLLITLSLYPQTNEVFKYNRKNLSNAYRYYNAKNYKKAAELFEYEIENSPILKIEYFENLANSYMNLRDYTNMLKTARSGIIVNRFSPKLHFQKGYALYKLGDTNKAIEAIRYSISLDPNDAYMNNFLGLLYLYVEDYKQAESSFLKATVYSPNNVVYMVNLAATYERDRNFSSALNVYEEAYKVNPNYRGLGDSIVRVKGIINRISGKNTETDTEVNETAENKNISANQNINITYDEDVEAKPIEMDNIYTNEIYTNTIDTNNIIINTNNIITNSIITNNNIITNNINNISTNTASSTNIQNNTNN
ncbi:tetratricopeptide repeat protein [Brachyspira murdochii]|uniref:TPR repeat-containing protein n=1 Tax=Brachyspira murdochii (strain ATCC 51284 / DSM 12563 / 56-150) TaxID=526224 RepID=D5U718_BRAM5|nr:tetratricopeptide repeat protein [Brachyspira murdochii]ADG72742.1 TPR repeat-containing protein [Brachyspira murdochii DSM 12563]